ncbi:MAG: hypothetical protein IPK03_14600 [Bacteroidetes bacterium]|nr:hypothetical protein [Bacteroidota bacterium]
MDFAENALNIKISKSGKRSRLEYIGLIVCEVINLNDYELTSLVNALYQLTDNKEQLNLVKEEMKKSNFSWNDTIQKLISKNV